MKTLVKSGLVAAVAVTFLAGVVTSAQAKKGYHCVVNKKAGVTHCVKSHKDKKGNVVHKTETTVHKDAKDVAAAPKDVKDVAKDTTATTPATTATDAVKN